MPRQKKSAKTGASSQKVQAAVTPEERFRMIAEAAYFQAEHRGFQGGSPDSDWFAAELEIDQLLATAQPAEVRKHPH